MKWPTVPKPEISFKCVVDEDGNQLTPSRFVMIVFILPCLGGVFTADPESYWVDNQGKVQKLEFHEWLVYFKMGKLPWALSVKPLHVIDTIPWSSDGRRKVYLRFTVELVQCRNNNNRREFKAWKKLSKKYPGADLVVASEEVAVQYKRHHFDEAYRLLLEFSTRVESLSQDKQFYQVRDLYLRSRIECAKGNYQNSYQIAHDCLQQMQMIPAEFITVWTYIHIAMLANIVGIKKNDLNKFVEARHWLDLALRDAFSLNNFPTEYADLYQKILIYCAMTQLRWSLTGKALLEYPVSAEDVDAAAKELAKVDDLVVTGHPMTQYREIQFLFGRCSIYLRHSQLSKSVAEKVEHLNHALKWAKQAKSIAYECQFKDMTDYAKNFSVFYYARG